MTAAVLLYTMRCNIECGHCSVDSHPRRREKMTLEQAIELVEGLARSGEIEFVDVSGGEPMLFRKELVQVARAAFRCGTSLRIVSNGFWATTRERASAVLTELVAAGVSSVGLSIDVWHRRYLPPDRVRHYVEACRLVGLQPFVSGVLAPTSSIRYDDPFPAELVDLLVEYGVPREECLDVYTWATRRNALAPEDRPAFEQACAERIVLVAWQALTGEGRAVNLEVPTTPFDQSAAEPCGAAGQLPTIDEEGRLFPCCAPWITRKNHALARVTGETIGAELRNLRRDPLVQIVHDRGPQVLIEYLRQRGHRFPREHSGICNQCGMLLDTVPLAELRGAAAELLAAADEAR